MTLEQFHNEQAFLIALSLINKLHKNVLMTTDEYEKALLILEEHFHPIIDSGIIVSRT